METKYITIPFDVERAKRIQDKEELGKIVTRDGRSVRIVCWDMKNDEYPIIALIDNVDKGEGFGFFNIEGKTTYYSEVLDLLISVPEWTTFKDGDIVTMGWENGDHYCKWISIIKVIDVFDGDICTRDYVALCIEADDSNSFSIEFDCESDAAKWIRTSTEEEIHELIEDLKESKDPKAKEYLKRFFGIEEKNVYEFKPFDKVLVRDDKNKNWLPKFFEKYTNSEDYRFRCMNGSSWKYCVPYDGNENLLGTSNDPE